MLTKCRNLGKQHDECGSKQHGTFSCGSLILLSKKCVWECFFECCLPVYRASACAINPTAYSSQDQDPSNETIVVSVGFFTCWCCLLPRIMEAFSWHCQCFMEVELCHSHSKIVVSECRNGLITREPPREENLWWRATIMGGCEEST